MAGTVSNSTRGLTSESHNTTILSSSPASPTSPQPQPYAQTTATKYYNSSSFFARTFDAAAEHVKSEIAASEPTECSGSQLRRGRGLRRRRDSVHDEDGESMAGVVELRGFVADGWVGGLGAACGVGAEGVMQVSRWVEFQAPLGVAAGGYSNPDRRVGLQ
jgi:hypothetical protein